MSDVEKHAPGSFCWVELGTTDSKAAKTFYTGLFGWEPDDMPMGPDQVYTMLKIGDKPVGALYQLDKSMLEMGIPPHWMLYVAVASAAKATQLGGSLKMPPSDIPNVGRFAIVADRQGATFSLFQPAPRH